MLSRSRSGFSALLSRRVSYSFSSVAARRCGIVNFSSFSTSTSKTLSTPVFAASHRQFFWGNSSNTSGGMKHVEVSEVAEALKAKKEGKGDAQFVDVREDGELQCAKVEGFDVHLPTSGIFHWKSKIGQILSKDKTVYVMCHHGMRSAQIGRLLVSEGFKDVRNVNGGIHAYATEVDKSVGTY